MIGKQAAMVAVLKQQDGIDRTKFMNYYCIIYQDYLCTLIQVFDETTKLIRVRALNHCQFQKFLRTKWKPDQLFTIATYAGLHVQRYFQRITDQKNVPQFVTVMHFSLILFICLQ